jgi:hypothetical protein
MGLDEASSMPFFTSANFSSAEALMLVISSEGRFPPNFFLSYSKLRVFFNISSVLLFS